jgi:hypothetical protein
MNRRFSSMEQQTISLTNQHVECHLKNAVALHRRLLLVDGPSWGGHEIKQNDEANIIIIDSTLIPCGSKEEYQTLIRLLQDPMECVAFCDLMPFFEYKRDRDTLGKRIQKLRRKLPPELTIRCESGVGYTLREKSHKKAQEVQQKNAPGM